MTATPLRRLDHIVWPTRDLDGLVKTFRALGFTVGSRNRHPWGTVNHIIQFDGVFLELLGFAEDYRPVPPDDPAYPFAGFCAAALERQGAGAAMIVLGSDDAVADAARFQAHGLGSGRILPFSRAAHGPDGADRTVAFTVAFAALPGLPEIGAFTCQQHRPENFWNPAMQRHPNGATGIAAVRIEAADPAFVAAALRRFAGGADELGSEKPVEIELANCAVSVSLPATGAIGLASITAIEFAIKSKRALDAAGVPLRSENGCIRAEIGTPGSTALRFR